MSFDQKVPGSLQGIQEWFASIITRPIDDQSHMDTISPSGCPMTEEAQKYVSPSPTLESHQRIELYNQQYWWRLLNTLHNSFPLVVRLLGYHNFNDRIAMPYLVKYPSHHWSLSFLGDRLDQWITEEYEGEDKQILRDAVQIDWAFNMSFFAQHQDSLTSDMTPDEMDPNVVLKRKACLQKHLYLFDLKYDLFKFRYEMKQKDPDFWSNHHYANLKHALNEGETHFPKLKQDRDYFFVLYRNARNAVVYEEMPEAEYRLLEKFREGATIEEVCHWLETQEEELYQKAIPDLQKWLESWIVKEWLTQA